jgi:hypothetical protein
VAFGGLRCSFGLAFGGGSIAAWLTNYALERRLAFGFSFWLRLRGKIQGSPAARRISKLRGSFREIFFTFKAATDDLWLQYVLCHWLASAALWIPLFLVACVGFVLAATPF